MITSTRATRLNTLMIMFYPEAMQSFRDVQSRDIIFTTFSNIRDNCVFNRNVKWTNLVLTGVHVFNPFNIVQNIPKSMNCLLCTRFNKKMCKSNYIRLRWRKIVKINQGVGSSVPLTQGCIVKCRTCMSKKAIGMKLPDHIEDQWISPTG